MQTDALALFICENSVVQRLMIQRFYFKWFNKKKCAVNVIELGENRSNIQNA